MKNALLIFVKNPSLGKVKTRLAKTIGDYNALKIYQHLLDHTMEITYELDADKFLYYSEYVPTKDEWPSSVYQKELQQGGHLGEKMNNAFMKANDEGYSKIVLMMPDCPKMTDTLIDKAFKNLDSSDMVIGPTSDKGFYLLGMKGFFPQIFSEKTYQTATDFDDTILAIEKSGKKYIRLTELTDVDTEEDLGKLKKMIKQE